ncbi:RNA pyrophosphohydrolase [Nocardia wallacei]|uniref:RNA pyrophosphohydrolase n=1 Tax=Nocardia wallacei TaxID=480035 RepID=UPI002458F509|nr:RNA pyrophosphohydrolase [Nocardia wallacei]
MPPKGQYFRANAGALILNTDSKALVLQRIDIPGAWQLPQGGLKSHEEPFDAALREINEETGIEASEIELLAEYPEWIAYELPPEARSEKTGRGQVQRWFVFRFNGSDRDIDLEKDEQEFSEFHWVELAEVVELAVDFRKKTYSAIVEFARERAIHS